MAPGVAQQIISAIQLLQGQDGTNRGATKIKQLHDNANYFRYVSQGSWLGKHTEYKALDTRQL